MRLQQLLEQSVSSSLLSDSHRRFPILCFKQSDAIALVLEKLAVEGLVSALVVSDTAHADQDEAKTDKQNAEHRLFSRVLVNEIKGFVDLSVVLQSFLRRATCRSRSSDRLRLCLLSCVQHVPDSKPSL